jgi:hypothetical protein
MFGPLTLVVRLVGRIEIPLAQLHDPACPALVEVELHCGTHPDGWAVHVWPIDPPAYRRICQATNARPNNSTCSLSGRRWTGERLGQGLRRAGGPDHRGRGRSGAVRVASAPPGRRPGGLQRRMVGAEVPGLVLAAIAVAAGMGLWRLTAPRSYRRLVSAPAGRARRRRRYRRMWPSLTAAHRLSWAPHPKADARHATWDLFSPKPATPKLEGVEIGEWKDRLGVRMLPGQIPADWENAVEGIAHTLGARHGRIRVTGPSRITIELAHGDPLAAVVPGLPVPAAVDLAAVSVGVTEDGSTWILRLAGSHVLVAGVTGAGKGSVIWSMLRGLCPAVAAGTAQVWAIDPKGGMELGPGRALFARFAADDFEAMAELLDTAVAIVRRQRARSDHTAPRPARTPR